MNASNTPAEPPPAPVLIHLDWLETGTPGGNPPKPETPQEQQ
ncbi:hypothetical protein OG455_41375 [Kitasatospora sp. NBC_01287]|nr:hypothetical protein [Kitasatospora sp. NBC_01287]MCX4750935.1 hypothetical protein [Kitasatospora sp. NBC_01287]MCX4751814.1 hypothetical protein [Kitasatospora sp. NBC_01287]MCX4751894.1 hypothetical protein [Kitasatospora sp. NBC_01287]